MPDQPITAVGYAMMAGSVADGSISSGKLASGAVGSAQLAAGSVGNTQLAAGAASANLAVGGQSAVASGGLVLSAAESASLVAAGFVKIATTSLADGWQVHGDGSPTAHTWTALNPCGAPTSRANHSAIWTGSEMLVFGGANGGYLNDTYGYSVGKTMFIYQKP
ncbi:MAG: hypothetical protein RLZZ522_88 [Verrucomicrobiota bacterium]